MAFNPYLFFGGNCRAAFTRYHEIFGGDLDLLTMADVPPDAGMPPGDPNVVMHAALMVGGALVMGSDDPTTDSFGPVQGMMISVSVPDPGEAKRVFDALAEGGTITQPLEATFWSPAFGMLVDQFGTPWMVGADAAEG